MKLIWHHDNGIFINFFTNYAENVSGVANLAKMILGGFQGIAVMTDKDFTDFRTNS